MKYILLLIIILLPVQLSGQTNNTFSFSGQVSAWANINKANTLPLWVGARYIPQANYRIPFNNGRLIDFEISANLNSSTGLKLPDSYSFNAQAKPYRAWARYSGNQFEIRLGLQKINFGSASMLRPLMWFDQLDPRDPLQLTDGVWGLLGRYYFVNNANIWIWGLYGNEGPKSWETGKTTTGIPEMGGRVQVPVPRGEAALSFHHRRVNTTEFASFFPLYNDLPESRYGFDVKWDVEVGLWVEAAWIQKHKPFGPLTNQEIINVGSDYTFGIGNGLNVVAEQLLLATDANPFEFENAIHFSGLSASYPIGIFDNVSAIIYYDWNNKNSYNFINWKKDISNVSLYLMGYWNPDRFNLPQQERTDNLFSGKGFQVMLVYNH